MTSSQRTALVASIKHQTVKEISCDANPDIIPRQGNKDRGHGMMHTHLHCKQQVMKVVDDQISMREFLEQIIGDASDVQHVLTAIGQREMESQNACRWRGRYL
jgi:alpha-D-ribose 1-methylphosphonate 5-triphosphate synthase subunit PhnI